MTRAWFLVLEEFGKSSSEEWKPDHTGTSLEKWRSNCLPSQWLTLAARSTMTGQQRES